MILIYQQGKSLQYQQKYIYIYIINRCFDNTAYFISLGKAMNKRGSLIKMLSIQILLIVFSPLFARVYVCARVCVCVCLCGYTCWCPVFCQWYIAQVHVLSTSYINTYTLKGFENCSYCIDLCLQIGHNCQVFYGNIPKNDSSSTSIVTSSNNSYKIILMSNCSR